MSDPQQPDPAGAPSEPALRASDADRERTVDVLSQAAGDGRLDTDELDERVQRAYATRTVTELQALTADVRDPETVATTTGAPVVRTGPGGTRSVISIMGGNDRAGRWRIAPRCLVLNIMGGGDIDLTKAELSDRVTTLNVVSIMGGSEIHVPRGVDVQVSKLALMGGNDVELDDAPPPTSGPVIHVRLFALMGGNEVKQGPKLSRAERRRQKELRRAEHRGEVHE